MSTLATALAIGDTQVHIDAALGVSPPFAIKVDSELLQVGGIDYRLGTTLALKYPATAAHAASATVTPVLDAFTEDASSPFAGGAGGVANPLTEDLDADGFAVTGASNLPTLLVDPGNVWEAETEVAEGYRIVIATRVLECSVAGESGAEQPDFNFVAVGTTEDGTVTWTYIGLVGEVPFSAFKNTANDLTDARIAEALVGQTVPLTAPSVQDVIDALVAAFGLVQED